MQARRAGAPPAAVLQATGAAAAAEPDPLAALRDLPVVSLHRR